VDQSYLVTSTTLPIGTAVPAGTLLLDVFFEGYDHASTTANTAGYFLQMQYSIDAAINSVNANAFTNQSNDQGGLYYPNPWMNVWRPNAAFNPTYSGGMPGLEALDWIGWRQLPLNRNVLVGDTVHLRMTMTAGAQVGGGPGVYLVQAFGVFLCSLVTSPGSNIVLQASSAGLLQATPALIPITGGQSNMMMTGPPNDPYVVLMTASGTMPGTQLGGLRVALNLDAFTTLGLNLLNSPGTFPGSLGVFDPVGNASASFIVPSLIGLPFHGLRLDFAYLTVSANSALGASNPASVVLW